MNAIAAPDRETTVAHPTSLDTKIRACVRLLMSNSELNRNANERRRDRRIAYPYPVYLTPLAANGHPLVEKTMVVIGKHLADRGLDFYHREPLPYGQVIASFDCGRGRWVSLALTLNWCRFSQHGWYDTGGRFNQVVSTPFDSAP